MKKIFKNKINIYLCISFIISITSIALVLNYVGDSIKYSLDSENFLKKFKIISINNKNELSMMEYLDRISNNNEFVYGNPLSSIIKNKDIEKQIIIFPIKEEKSYILKNKEIDGNYFDKRNINEGKKVAIIGNSLKDMCKTIEGKKYIDIKLEDEKLEYEVIAVIENNEYLASSIFIPYKSLYETKVGDFKSDKYKFLIPSKSEYKNCNFNVEEIEKYHKKGVFKIVLTELFDMFDNIKNLLICTILGVINITIFSMFWIRSNKRKISILKVLGADNKYIFKYVFIRVTSIGIIGAIIGGFIIIILSNIIYIENSIKFSTLIVSIIATFIISIIATIFSYMDILKFNIIKYIR